MGATGLRRPDAQKLLGKFLFSGWEQHEKPVTALSGGERRRLCAGDRRRERRPNLALGPGRGEPTIHLSTSESREALRGGARGLSRHCVLLVTHDRALLDAVSGRACSPSEERRLVFLPRRLEPSLPARRARKPCAAAWRTPGTPARRAAHAAGRAEARPPRATPLEQLEGEITRTGAVASRSSSGSSRRTGPTSTSSRPTVRRAPIWARCSPAGSACSRRRRPELRSAGSALERGHRQSVALELAVVELGELEVASSTRRPARLVAPAVL